MSVFRDQPLHTHFNKFFEDNFTDSFSSCLNEIDTIPVRQEHHSDINAFKQHVLYDPRTGKAVKQVFYDHSKTLKNDSGQAAPKIFRANQVSSMTKEQHAACVRVQRAWQEQLEVHESDLYVWRRLQLQRMRENEKMFKFISQYAQAHKEEIYAPTKRLVELYKRWYARQTETLLQREPEMAFNTHLGMPHVSACTGNNSAELVDVQLLQQKGCIPVLQKDKDYRRLHAKLETYAALYQETQMKNEIFTTNEIRSLMKNLQLPIESSKFIIPLDTLLFLFTAGEYCDLPSEVLLDIVGDINGENKLIIFKTPLPARHCGFHTHKKMLQHSMCAFQSIPETTKWLSMDKNEVTLNTDAASTEIVAMQLPEYVAPLKFETYLQKYENTTCQMPLPETNKKLNSAALIKWCLKKTSNSSIDEDNALTMFTTLPLPEVTQTDSNTENFAINALKLEYKPQFGCEIMTKFELLEIWLRMRLLNKTSAHCIRISVGDFTTQLEQSLTLSKVERNLHKIYQINMPELLAKLDEFLRLLLKIGVGCYMLRYNPKIRNKLMLCALSREITQNTVSLHALLRSEPSDLLFMTQKPFLPIAYDLCSIVHLHHEVLPCAFLPTSKLSAVKSKDKRPPVVNDRLLLLKRVEKKTEQKRLQNSHKNRAGKTRKRKRTAAQKKVRRVQQMNNDESELQRDMQADKLLFG